MSKRVFWIPLFAFVLTTWFGVLAGCAKSAPEVTTTESPQSAPSEDAPGTETETAQKPEPPAATPDPAGARSSASASQGRVVPGSAARPGTPARPARSFESKEVAGKWQEVNKLGKPVGNWLELNEDGTGFYIRGERGREKGIWKVGGDQVVFVLGEGRDESGGRMQYTVAPDGKSIYDDTTRFERR